MTDSHDKVDGSAASEKKSTNPIDNNRSSRAMNPTVKAAYIGFVGIFGFFKPAPDRVQPQNSIGKDISSIPISKPPSKPVFTPKTPHTESQYPISENVELSTPQERYDDREHHYLVTDYVQLAHVLTPSNVDDQAYDVFIFLVRHKARTNAKQFMRDIQKAEFFLGEKWGNQIFTGTRSDSTIGIRVSAYGPMLCTCKITFTDGRKRMLYRYIDFEMGKYLHYEDSTK